MTKRIAILLTAFTVACAAADAPLPAADPIPVVSSPGTAEKAIAAARAAQRGYAVDLTTGSSGTILKAASKTKLAPGRYRLHALVATTPHDNFIVDAVELVLQVNKASRRFERQKAFPKPGKLRSVYMDFAVKAGPPVLIKAGWFVGDSMLDLKGGLKRHQARKVYAAQRQNALNMLKLKQAGGPGGGLGEDDDELLLDEEEDKQLQLRKLSGWKLPPYRLLLAGLVIERISPVRVLQVQTEKAVYAPDEPAGIQVLLRNAGDAAADVKVKLTVAVDGKNNKQVLGPYSVTLPAGKKLQYDVPDTISLPAAGTLAHIHAVAAVETLRPDVGHGLLIVQPPQRAVKKRPKKVFAHYMGCWPAGRGPLRYERLNLPQHFRHESKDDAMKRGAHVRNFDLVPPDKELTQEESADLEIRRAMRIGIDGFAINAWAGGNDARKSLDLLFKVAETKDYPFELTVCIDAMCGGSIVDTVRYVLDKYGKSPKLARRDGKPLVFGYMSTCNCVGYMYGKARVAKHEQAKWITSPQGWHLMGQAFLDAERKLGQDIYYHYGVGYFFLKHGKAAPKGALTEATKVLSRYVEAFGGFSHVRNGAVVGKAVQAAGAEWGGAIGMYQKENIPFETYSPKGTEWLEGKWADMRRQKTTLLQLITWNDYGENTNIAPAYDTRYTLYDLTGYHIQWWKTGKQPQVDHDRVYLIYAKYPRGAKVYPFHEGARRGRALEVLTILTKPGKIRLPGRNIEYDAPAGYHREQFPLKPGAVVAEVIRDGKVDVRLESPEPITDKPFRESNGFVCHSTEFTKHWQADFGKTKPFLYSEYGDVDKDGLPNWFEMYWFSKERKFKPERSGDLLEDAEEIKYSKWLDFSTAGVADPDADPDRDGKSNLEEYRNQTDPTINPNPEMAVEPDGLLD